MSQKFFNFATSDNEAILHTIAKVVGSTLGPNGKSAIIGNGNKTYTTKDGVSVLRLISSEDNYIQNVINVIREASENTLKEAGDGTTSTIILADQLLQLIKGSRLSKADVRKKINDMISKIEDISSPLNDDNAKELIATAVGNEPELINVLYDAYKMSTEHDVPIIVETISGNGNKSEIIDGISFQANIVSNVFSKDEISIAEPHVICYAGNIESEKEVVKAIDKCLKMGIKDVVIIANGYAEEALAIMSINHLRGGINIVPLIVSGGDVHNNEVIEVIAKSLDCEIGGENFSMRLYDSFTQKYNKTSVFRFKDGKATFEDIKYTNDTTKLIKKYESQLSKAEDDYEMNKILFLLSMLKRKLVKAIIASPIKNKVNELKDRADDAIHNLITAKIHGVVKGSGMAYIELNRLTADSKTYDKCFYYINNLLKTVSGGLDSSKTIESVLRSSSELALLLDNVEYVIDVKLK